MDELRIVTVHVLSDLDNGFLEVKGGIVIRRARHVGSYANHPDPMLELDRAAIRFHLGSEPDYWEEVESISLNRDRVLLIIPLDDEQASLPPAPPAHEVRVKLVCHGLIVTGFVTLPVKSTISTLIHETRDRFLGVRRARVMTAPGAPELQDFPALHELCLVNRSYVAACIETRAQVPETTLRVPERESV